MFNTTLYGLALAALTQTAQPLPSQSTPAGPAGSPGQASNAALPPASALPGGFLEAFALAEDRAAALGQLIPGTEDHDYYRSLYLQGLFAEDPAGRAAELREVDGILKGWSKRRGRTWSLRQIEARQALLRASSDPASTYAFLERELELKFNHRRRIPGEVPNLPTELDPTKISTETLLQGTLEKSGSSGIRSIQPALLEQLVRRDLSKSQRAALLDALPRADVPGLVEVILADLAAHKNSAFGSRKIHSRLTLAQLESLRGALPNVTSNQEYVYEVLRRLNFGPTESKSNPADRRAYLDRAWRFVETLPPAFNSLKAHVLFRIVEEDLTDGAPNADRLRRYLRMPRPVSYWPSNVRRGTDVCNLGEGFGGVTPFAAIGDDTKVVTASLELLLRGENAYDRYLDVVEESFLRRVFAESKLIYGNLAGDASMTDRYVEMLGGAAALDALKDRVEVQFARGGRAEYAAREEVTLEVDLKNVSRLIVKVFQIDPVAAFDRIGNLNVGTLDLDGLVAGDERVYEYTNAPLNRHRETFLLDSLRDPGLYVVEMIGGGVSSRAVVRKGALHLLGRVGSAGHVFQVIDGDRKTLKSAILRFGGRDFVADENGEISVPFTVAPGTKSALLRAGDVSAVARFQHLAESYKLDASVHAPAEALLSGMAATFTVRPRLTVSGELVDLSLLENPRLLIGSVDIDGNRSTKVVGDLTLVTGGLLSAEVQVPERTTEFTVSFAGETRSLSEGKDVELRSDTQSFPINRIQPMGTVQSLLTRRPDGYVLEVRGRAGEPRSDVEVRLSFQHRHFGSAVEVRLKSDADGRVNLGGLVDIAGVRVEGPTELRNSWSLAAPDVLGLADEIHGLAGKALRIPYSGTFSELDRRALSFLEVRGGEVLRDAFESARIENRYVVLEGLQAGDYRLELKESGQSHMVRIVDGNAAFGHVIGRRRALSQSDAVPLQIVEVFRDGDDLVAQLAGLSEHTRLTAVGTKYVDPFEPSLDLALDRLRPTRVSSLVNPRTTYESGRAISDEYRYILDRRRMTAYPGNMLDRPGYLLNPWVINQTDDRMMEDGDQGGAYAGASPPGAAVDRMGRSRSAKRAAESDSAQNRTVDFLAVPAAVLRGLRPDENGRVRIPLGELGPNHMIRLVATDLELTVALDVTREEQDLERRDQRLMDPLDASRPMTQQRRVIFVQAGESIEIRDAVNAGAQTYDSLGDVFRLYRTVAGEGSEVAKFEFLTRWPSLTEGEKHELFSEYVCHELNVFLKRKDPVFFEGIVAPYLANKGHRTFMDDWLLGEDLAMYLEPWCFERLNVVEKILLLRQVDGDAAGLAEDLMALVPRGQFSVERAFGQVLLAGKLNVDQGVVAESMRAVRKMAAEEKSLGGEDDKPSARLELRGLGIGGGGRGRITAGRDLAGGLLRSQTATPAAPDAGAGPVGLPTEEVESGAYFGLADPAADAARREGLEAFFFRDLDATQELAETHYWRTRLGAADAGLITVSPFWVDLAKAEGDFVSGQFPLATRNTAEMLLALAFLDLPFEAKEHGAEAAGRSVIMTAGSPLLLALEDIGDAAPKEGAASLLVGQDYFRPERRTHVVDGVETELYESGEFLTGRPYGSRVVITNPSSSSIELQALIQIPEGALPLESTRVTQGIPISIGPYGTQSIDTYFYFPETGEFRGYPVHAGQGAVLLGAAGAQAFNAVKQLSEEDTTTWEWVSQNAELGEVLDFLRQKNPHGLDLEQIAWRMQDGRAFSQVTGVLAQQNLYSPVLWQYAVKHRDAKGASAFLSMNPGLIGLVGAPFQSPMLTVDPEKRALYEHLAYEPLVNGRTYAFGGQRKILNDQFQAQYMAFLGNLARGSSIDSERRMELCYYLLLQERVGEALAHFSAIDRSAVRTQIQYDYMAAVLAFYREDIQGARTIAERYADHPVARWSSRFGNVMAQLDEIEGRGPSDAVNPDDRDQSQGALASNEPVLAVHVEDGKLVLDYERIEEVEVRYHRMDIEFLFSNSPFVRGDEGAFGLVRPNRSEVIALSTDDARRVFELPAAFQGTNVLVEVRGAGLSRRTTYFAGDLVVQGLERYGQVRVVDGATKSPLPKTYVKVYAKLSNGQVRFHKDGYTDLRGRFDYVSLSGVQGPPVERYSVLVMNEASGATIQELSPPAR